MRKQSADVLAMLAKNIGQTVSKDALVKTIWPDVVTTDDSLVQCIADIRRAIGREAIKTYPKKGYQLQPSKNTSPKPNATDNKSKYRIVVTLPIGILLLTGLVYTLWPSQTDISRNSTQPHTEIQGISIAVLPFTILGGREDVQFFSDGLSEDLTTDLSKVPGLTVISSASSFDFPGAEHGLKKIAQILGVHYLVRGTVRSHDNQLRLNVSLIDPYDGFNLWAERYDKAEQDPFDVQEKITSHIVNSLSLTFDGHNSASQTINPDAYYMLLKGLEPLRKRTLIGNAQARGYFEQALDLDPQYARAYASIALSYGREITLQDSNNISPASIENGLNASIAAIQIDANIPQAYLALGLLNLSLEEYDNALAAAHHAVELDVNYSDGYALLAELALYAGDLEEALTAIRWAKRLHPRHPPSYTWIEGHILYLLKYFDEALPLLEQLTSNNPNFLSGLTTLAATYIQLGQSHKAADVFAKAQSVNDDIDPIEIVKQTKYRYSERREMLLEDLQKIKNAISIAR